MKRMQKIIFMVILAFILPMMSYANSWNVPDLNIGDKSLPQQVEHTALAKGVDFYNIKRGYFENEHFILSSGVLNDKQLTSYSQFLHDKQIPFSIENAPETAPNGKALGKIIRIRAYTNELEAQKQAESLSQEGVNFSVRFSAQDGYLTKGPFSISLLRIDLNQYEGQIRSVLANEKIQGAETVSSMAARNQALAAVNGGFFAFDDVVGDFGAPAGIYVHDGELLREATNDRPVLIIDNSQQKSQVTIGTSVTSELWITINNAINNQIRIDGLNRKPGVILNCGGYRTVPTTEAVHDFVCTNDNEVILYNQHYGPKTPNVSATEIIIDETGKVLKISNQTSTEINPNYQYLQLTGKSNLPINVGDNITIDSKVWVEGKEIKLNPKMSMINSGPTLVTDYAVNNSLRDLQGFNPYSNIGTHSGGQDDDNLGVSNGSTDREAFYDGWALRRHPRTALGITNENIVYAVVVYGRNPTITEGASITDMSKLMQALQVKDALNLDGGGSSMMVIEGKPTGTSSDAHERQISDAIIFTH